MHLESTGTFAVRCYSKYNNVCNMKGCHLLLSVTVYEVHVTTGDLWNAGTEADVYISIYGEKGDTGSRQLLRSQKPKKFVKGQVSTRAFSVFFFFFWLFASPVGSNAAIMRDNYCIPTLLQNSTIKPKLLSNGKSVLLKDE